MRRELRGSINYLEKQGLGSVKREWVSIEDFLIVEGILSIEGY